MKVIFILALIVLTSTTQTKSELETMAVSSISLAELLERVKEISNQLAEDNQIDLPLDVIKETKIEDPDGTSEDF